MLLGLTGCADSSPPTATHATGTAGPTCTAPADQAIHFQLPQGFAVAEKPGMGGSTKETGRWEKGRHTTSWSAVGTYTWTGSPDTSDKQVLRDAILTFGINTFGPQGDRDIDGSPGVRFTSTTAAGKPALQASWTQQQPPTAEDPKHAFTWWLVRLDRKDRYIVAAHAPAGAAAQSLEQQLGSSLTAGPCGT